MQTISFLCALVLLWKKNCSFVLEIRNKNFSLYPDYRGSFSATGKKQGVDQRQLISQFSTVGFLAAEQLSQINNNWICKIKFDLLHNRKLKRSVMYENTQWHRYVSVFSLVYRRPVSIVFYYFFSIESVFLNSPAIWSSESSYDSPDSIVWDLGVTTYVFLRPYLLRGEKHLLQHLHPTSEFWRVVEPG